MPTPEALRTVAMVAEVLGEHGVDVLDASEIHADSDGEVVHAEVRIEAPIGAEQPASVATAGETGGDDTAPDDPVNTEGGADAGDNQERHQCPDCDYATDSARGLNIHRSKAHGDHHDDVWCEICGDGPFAGKSSLAGHHNGAGHEGDLHPVDEPPANGTTGGGFGGHRPRTRVRRRRAGLARRAIVPRGCRAERGPRRADHVARVRRSRATGGARQGDQRRRRAQPGGELCLS